MINTTSPITSTTNSTHNVNMVPIIFGIAIGTLSIISIIILTAYLCSRKPSPLRRTNSFSSTDDQDSIRIEMGLDEATLNSYPKILYSQAKIDKGNPETSTIPTSCSICLQEYKDSDMARLLPDCNHLFHIQCIDPWLKLHRTCPVCRNSPVQSPNYNLPEVSQQRLSHDSWFVQIM